MVGGWARAMTGARDIPVEGVTALDHTADVGLEVEAPDLPELFRRGALGAMWLVLERQTGADSGHLPETRTLELEGEDLASLFRSWLRALLYWEETEEFVTREVTLSMAPAPSCFPPDGLAFALSARVEGVVDKGSRVREIKGVTLHGLRVEQHGRGWQGRVIFDV